VASRVQQSNDIAMLRDMSQQLGQWFVHHAQTMDAALALHLRTAGFDQLTGIVSMPEAIHADVIHGCGGSACSTTGQGRGQPLPCTGCCAQAKSGQVGRVSHAAKNPTSSSYASASKLFWTRKNCPHDRRQNTRNHACTV
jgi:hypothetical protein